MVTPIGICLSYYEQNNNFIYVSFNDERIILISCHDSQILERICDEIIYIEEGKIVEQED